MKAELPDKSLIFLTKGCFSTNTFLLSSFKVQNGGYQLFHDHLVNKQQILIIHSHTLSS